MQDPPKTEAILELVAAFLRDEVMPQVSGSLAFQVRVCANAVDLARRHMELAPASDAAELASLRRLLGAEGDLDTLNTEFCDRIRRREIDLATPGVLGHLRAATLAKLAVDQPGYAAYRRAKDDWGDASPDPAA
jgi:hypothetical protein